ncbi:MAG: DUF1127 domain-containing protein [Pseudomonadota bacterium]
MAYYNDVTQRTDVLEQLLTTVAQLFTEAAARRARNRIYRNTLAEMQTLSSRELADLGLHRSELKRIAWDAAVDAVPN